MPYNLSKGGKLNSINIINILKTKFEEFIQVDWSLMIHPFKVYCVFYSQKY